MSSVSGAQSKCQLYTDRFLLLDHTFLYGAVYLAGGFNYFRIKITKKNFIANGISIPILT